MYAPTRIAGREWAMEIVLFWLVLCIVVAVAASTRGRSSIGWFLISAVFSPIVGGLFVLALPSLRASSAPSYPAQSKTQSEPKNVRACPFCAELIKMEAKICPHCRSPLPALDPSFLKDYPQVHRGIRYRCERDGSVVMATPEGPRRFENWGQFWEVVN